VADEKHIALALAVSLKNMCFRFCCCNRSAVSIAITGATSGAPFQHSNAISPSASSRRINRRVVRSPTAALH